MNQCFMRERYNICSLCIKTFVKYEILKNYVDRYYEANCVTCHFVALTEFYIMY